MDMTGYKTEELLLSIDIDHHAVRKEAQKRAEKAEKAAKRAKAAYERAMKEIDLCAKAISASYEM